MISNFHTHTYRCLHAFGTEEDYTAEAIKQHIKELGFSDHAPFPDRDFGYRMQYNELDEYIKAVEQSKEKHKEEILIYKGLEIEYIPIYENYYRELLEEKGLDYLALGEHIYMGSDGKLKNIFYAKSTENYKEYALRVCEAIETGLFRYVAHPDVMFANYLKWDSNCEKAVSLIVECAEKNDAILEYNANGIRKGIEIFPDGSRYPYPHKYFWEAVKDKGIRVIIGSDCHAPEQINDKFVKAAENSAAKMGLNVIESIF